jgi:hypothetical protein
MTTIREAHRWQYREREGLQARIDALQEIIVGIRDSRLPMDSKRRMLNHAVWEVTIARGDFVPEHRSHGVQNGVVGAKIQREHVYPRKRIVDAILEKQEPLEEILRRVIHCVVTVDEAARLNKVPATVDGWKRYSDAEVDVYSYAGEQPKKRQS